MEQVTIHIILRKIVSKLHSFAKKTQRSKKLNVFMRAIPFHLYKRFPLVDINGRLAKWAIPFHLDNTLLLFPLVQPWLELREITFCALNPTYSKRGKNKTKQTMKQVKQESIDPRRDSPSQSRETSIDCICSIHLGAFLTKFSKCSNNLFTVH